MRNLEIDPMTINNDEARTLLGHLFQEYQKTDVFSQHEWFELASDDVCLRLTKTVLRAPNQQSDQTRYHIISNHALGRGSNGTVYPIEVDMLVYRDEHASIVIDHHKPNPPQVVKYKRVSSALHEVIQGHINRWEHEYKQSTNDHLNAELPVFSIQKIELDSRTAKYSMEMFLPMNRMPGIEFWSFLFYILNPQCHVSLDFRFSLTFELLDKFYEQVVRNKQVHGDLKPENMMFEMDIDHHDYDMYVLKGGLAKHKPVPRCHVNVIDFESSEQFDVPRTFFRYTEMYAAAETRAMVDNIKKYHDKIYPAVHDEKTDMVSIAFVIGIIWGAMPDNIKKIVPEEHHSQIVKQLIELYFSDESEACQALCLTPIYAAILCMIDPDPVKRWNLEQTNMFFEDVFARYYQQQVLIKPTSNTINHFNIRPDSVMSEGMPYDCPDKPESGEETAECSPVSILDEAEVLNDVIVCERNPYFFVKPEPQYVAKAVGEEHTGCGCILS